MPTYVYLILFVILAAAIIFIFLVIRRRKNIPATIFADALRSENNGDYKDAIMNYRIALEEAKKANLDVKYILMIIEKIKVLHTVIEYENNCIPLAVVKSEIIPRLKP